MCARAQAEPHEPVAYVVLLYESYGTSTQGDRTKAIHNFPARECMLRAPKSARKMHPFCVRLEHSAGKKKGVKLILDLCSEGEKADWARDMDTAGVDVYVADRAT